VVQHFFSNFYLSSPLWELFKFVSETNPSTVKGELMAFVKNNYAYYNPLRPYPSLRKPGLSDDHNLNMGHCSTLGYLSPAEFELNLGQ
jgi:hypothetical protein